MAEELKIKIIGSLDSNKTTDQIQEQLKKIEKNLNVQLSVDANAISKINTQIDQLQKKVGKGIKIVDDKEMIDSINQNKKLFSTIDDIKKAYKGLDDTIDVKTIFNPNTQEIEAYNVQIKKAEGLVENLRFEMAKLKDIQGLDGLLLTKRDVVDKREIEAQKALQKTMENRRNQEKKLAEEQAKAINKNAELERKQIEDSKKALNDYENWWLKSLKEREIQHSKTTKKMSEDLELYKRNAQIDADKLLKTHSSTVDKGALDSWVSSVDKLNADTPDLNNKLKHMSLSFKEIKSQASEAARSSMSMADSLRTAFQKFPVWLLASTSIYGTIAATRNLYDVIIQVDTAMTNLQKVMSQDTNFDNVMSNATDSAERFAKTITETLEAYETFAKQGYKDDDLQFLGDAGLVASNVGEIDTTAASEYLTSALVQWNKETNEAMGIVDSWNALSNDYATTVEKLAQGHGRAASTARNMGLSFDETNAIIGSLTASTKQSGNEIGNFLKNVLPRLTSQPAQDALSMVRVDLLDQSGNMRNVVDVYTDVAMKLKDMDAYNKSIVTEGLAGKFHISRMSAFLNDLASSDSMYRSMVESSENSLGSASAENEKYMQSLQARVQETRLEFEKMALALGESFMTEGLIQTLKGLNSLMSSAVKLTETFGALPLILGAIGLGFGALSKNLNNFTQGLIFSAEGATRAEIATKGFGRAIKGLAATTGVGIAFLAIGFALDKLLSKVGETRKAQEELEQKNNELMASYKQSRGDVAGLTSEYERLQEVISSGNYTTDDLERYKEIQNSLVQSIPSLVIGEDQYGNKVLASADSVKAKVDMLERQLAIQEKIEAIENKEQSQENYDTAKESLEDYEKTLDKVITKANKGLTENRQSRRTQSEPNIILEDIDAIISKIEELENKQLDGTLSANEMVDLNHLREIQDEFTKAGIKVDQAKLMMVSANNELVSSSLATNEKISSSAKSLIGDFSLFVSSTDESAKKIDSVLGSLGDNIESNPAFVKSFEEYSSAIDTYKEKVESGLDPKDLEQYKNSAVKSFNEVKNVLISLASEGKLSEESLNLLEAKLGILANSSVFTTQSLDELARSTGMSKDEIMNQLLLVPELAGEMDNLSTSVDGASQSQEEFVSSAERIAGVSQKNIDKIKESIAVYQLLNDMESLNASQKAELANVTSFLSSTYPALVQGKKLNINAMQKEAEQNEILLHAVDKMANGQLNAQEEMTVQQALGARARLQVLSSELKALEKMANAYMQAAEDAYSQASRYGDDESLIQTEKFYRRSQQMSSKYNSVKSEIDSLIPSIDSLTRSMSDSVDYSGKAYKSTDALEKELGDSTKATEKAAKEYENSTYISDKFAKALESINLQIEKQNKLQATYTSDSKQYQSAIKNEIKLLEQKKKLIESQAKSLEQQIRSGKIAPTGIVTSSSVSSSPVTISQSSNMASGGGTAAQIWNFFKSKGFSDSIVAGIMGNLKLESGLKTTARNPSSGAYGIAQWLGSRKTGLANYAASSGTSMSSLSTQLNFLWKELNSTEKRTMNYLSANQNASASTIAAMFDKLFERSEGTHIPQRQAYANQFMSQFNGTAGSYTPVAGSVSQAQSEQSKEMANNMQAIDQARSTLYSLRGDVLSIEEEIAGLQKAYIEAILSVYERRIKDIDYDLARKDNHLASLDSSTSTYREVTGDKKDILYNRQKENASEIAYLNSIIQKGGLAQNVLYEFKEKLKELNLERQEMFQQQRDLSGLVVDSYLEELNLKLDELNSTIEISTMDMENFKEGTEGYTKASKDQLKAIAEKKYLYEVYTKQLQHTLETEKLTSDKQKEINAQIRQFASEIRNLENSVMDMREQYADRAIDALKKSYEMQRDLEVKAKEKQISDLEEVHDKKMEQYDEDLERFEEIINEKMRLLDEQEDEEDWNKELSKLQQEERSLKSKIATLSLSSSMSDQTKRLELEEQLADLQEQIGERKTDREREQRKKNLQDQLDAFKDSIDDKKESEQKQFDLTKKRLEEERDAIEWHYQELLNDEIRFGQMREDIIKGNTRAVSLELEGFLKNFQSKNEDVVKALGMSWTSLIQIIKAVKEASGDMSDMPTIPNLPGTGTGGGSESNRGRLKTGTFKNKEDAERILSFLRDIYHASNTKIISDNGMFRAIGEFDSLERAQRVLDDLKKNGRIGVGYVEKFHQGGIVGGKGSKLANLFNNLFNSKPNEQVIKSLKGELQVPPQNFMNGIQNLKNLITPNLQPAMGGNVYNLNPTLNITVQGGKQAGKEIGKQAMEHMNTILRDLGKK